MSATTAGDLGLPEPLTIAGFEGSVCEWLQRCRWQLEAIVDGHIQPWGRPVVACCAHEQLFWHIVTSDDGPCPRRLDIGRCELLGQVWDVLERLAAADPRVCWWPVKDRRGRSIHVAPIDFSLVVVLKECRTSYLLLTAYPKGPRRRAKLMERAAMACEGRWSAGHTR